jgi:DNA-directed RNA polymerase specialized sigma24 family protein
MAHSNPRAEALRRRMQELHRRRLDQLEQLAELEALATEVHRARTAALVEASAEFTQQELAEVLGITRSAVQQRLDRARRGGS